MRGFQGDGYTEMVGDWTLAMRLRQDGHEISERECLENFGHNNEVRLADIEVAEFAAIYSFSAASFWKLTDNYHPGVNLKALFIVLGVPDIHFGQGAGVWHPKKWIDRQYCFQIDEAFPRSFPLQGSIPWFNINDPHLIEKLLKEKAANINCRPLFGSWANFVAMHTTTQNRTEVQEVIAGILKGLQQEVSSGQ